MSCGTGCVAVVSDSCCRHNRFGFM